MWFYFFKRLDAFPFRYIECNHPYWATYEAKSLPDQYDLAWNICKYISKQKWIENS